MVKPLEELSIGRRIVLTAAVVIVALLLLALFGYLTGGWEAQGETRSGPSLILMLPPSKWDAKIIELDKQALDEAYVNKIKLLFDVWVREGRETPERPVKGATEARRAYIEIMQAIEQRERIINERKP